MMIENSQETLQAFISERAENLAIIHLTRRPDLSIQRMPIDQGLDLFIEILENDKPTGQVFGLQIKARASLPQIDPLSLSLKPESLKYAKSLPFPVCLFLFEMEGDRGFYTWLKSPSQPDQPPETAAWQPLTPEALDQIINHITAWYRQKQKVAA